MFGIGRDLCGSSSPTLLPKQSHLQQAAQDFVQEGFEYLQRRRLHSLPGQPVPVLRHSQREEVLPHVHTELPVPQFVPIAPCPVAGHHWKESGPIFLTPILEIFIRSPAEFQHPCRDRNNSHTLMQCTVGSLYCSACVVIYIPHICKRNHAYLDRLQT